LGLAWIASLLLLSDSTVFVGPVEAAEKISGQISVQDALTVPGRAVRIEARLIRKGFLGRTGLGGEQLEFRIDNKKAGTAMTGGDGRAILEYTPRMRGTQVVTVGLPTKTRVESQEASATIASWERRRPILLVDMAALIEDAKTPKGPIPSLPLDLGRRDPQTPIPDAAEELKRLTEYFFNVVYLERSGEEEGQVRDEAREWLKRHRLPIGLLRTVKPGQAALEDLIDSFRAEGWTNLKAGIGRTRDFAEALVDRRMEVIILPATSKDENLPKKAQAAKDWKDVRRKLQS
jgi:hypothetical protein